MRTRTEKALVLVLLVVIGVAVWLAMGEVSEDAVSMGVGFVMGAASSFPISLALLAAAAQRSRQNREQHRPIIYLVEGSGQRELTLHE